MKNLRESTYELASVYFPFMKLIFEKKLGNWETLVGLIFSKKKMKVKILRFISFEKLIKKTNHTAIFSF